MADHPDSTDVTTVSPGPGPEHADGYADMADLRDEGSLVHLDVTTCLDLLAGQHVGRIALNDPAGPVVFPVNYTVDAATVVFRTTMGTKLAAAEDHDVVTFQVDQVDEQRRMGWSVLVRGRLVEVVDPDELDRLRALPLDPFTGAGREHYVRVMAASVTGRRIPIPDVIPAAWLRASTTNTWQGQDGDDLLG